MSVLKGVTIITFWNSIDQAKPVIGNYAATNKNEYFAEFFEKWFDDTDVWLQRLQEAAPETYAYFAKLEKQGWLPERT
mgnify:CR=1 FL=1